MKNITVSVDDEIYHRSRMKAAELKTSVSALVRASLTALADEETEFERLKRLEREVVDRLSNRGQGFSASGRLTREEAHDRNALR